MFHFSYLWELAMVLKGGESRNEAAGRAEAVAVVRRVKLQKGRMVELNNYRRTTYWRTILKLFIAGWYDKKLFGLQSEILLLLKSSRS